MKRFHIFIIAMMLGVGGIATTQAEWVTPAYAADGHDHEGHGEKHDENNAHEEEAHGEEHGHGHDEKEAHGEEDSHEDNDGHGHQEKGGHEGEDDGHGHGDEHEEGRTEIDADAVKSAGIRISKAEPKNIQEMLTLTGRIILNRNTTADVRARFSGIVRSVKVNLGQRVKKGQPLATVESNESLSVYTITAPTDGVVLTRNTNIGNVAGDDALFTIANLSEVWAEFHVFPRDLGQVSEGQQVRVHTIENNKEIEAPITLILPTADPLSQTVIAVVSIPNAQGKWRPGMTVEGDVHISEKQVPVAITAEAVQRMENKTVVFVKEGDAYEMRPIKVGKGDGKYIEVREGLKAGEQYVSQGSFIVKADIGKAAAKHEH